MRARSLSAKESRLSASILAGTVVGARRRCGRMAELRHGRSRRVRRRWPLRSATTRLRTTPIRSWCGRAVWPLTLAAPYPAWRGYSRGYGLWEPAAIVSDPYRFG